MNPNTAPTLATYLDRLAADARADLGLPPTPPEIPSLESVLAAQRSRARAELANDTGDIDRDFIAGVRRWETAETAERLAGMSPAMCQSMISIMAQMDDPEFQRTSELSPAWVEAETTGYTPGPTTSGIEGFQYNGLYTGSCRQSCLPDPIPLSRYRVFGVWREVLDRQRC